MQTIPISYIVKIIPSVLAAAGVAVTLNGMVLTTSPRVPVGSIVTLPDAPSVSAYFGPSSAEYAEAQVYFNGYDGSLQKPSALKFSQYNTASVAAYLRGGSLATLTLDQLQALTGTLIVVIDGITQTSGTINLSAATSFSNAATLIGTALNAFDASFTATIANITGSATGGINGTTFTCAVAPAVYLTGGTGLSGSGVTGGTTILNQLTGTPGGIGTYLISVAQTLAPGSTVTCTNGLMTVTAVASGALANGQVVAGAGVAVPTTIVQFGSGTGATGTYQVVPAQIVSSVAMTSGAAAVTFDSVAQAFVITSGSTGVGSTIGYASGTIASGLGLTAANGAVISKGAAPLTPNSAMTAIRGIDQNWGAFMTIFKPSITDMVSFAGWTNAQLNSVAYVMWDTDAAPTTSTDTTSAGHQIQVANYSGTFPIYEPSNLHLGAMVLGFFASIDFGAVDGRVTFAFMSQTGISPSVTDATTAKNLTANGYNYYGAFGGDAVSTATNIVYPGSISGPYLWADSYANEIWMNSNFQASLFGLLLAVKFIPYNPKGYSLIDAALMDPITQAVSFGAIQENVTLSAAEAAEVDNAAGVTISPTLQTRGWYLQIVDPPATVRAQRGSPPMKFWYMDGESVQQMNLSSILVQ